MRVLVTGAEGYVGRATVASLAREGHKVWSLDRTTPSQGDTHLRIDLSDTDRLTELLMVNEIEAVIHAAALTSVPESTKQPARYYANNVAGSLSLFAAMQAANVSKIVFSSSSSVYDNPDDGMHRIREDYRRLPRSPYGRTKLWIEEVLADYCGAHGWGAIALRYFNIAGGLDESERLIPRILQVALGRRRVIEIHGTDFATPDGTCVRDYVHLEDVVRANIAALTSLREGQFRPLNIGTGRGTSVREVIGVCRQVTSRFIDAQSGFRNSADLVRVVADISAAAEVLNWKPRYELIESIVASAWEAHLSCDRCLRSSRDAVFE